METKKLHAFHWLIIILVSILSLIFLSLINPLSAVTYYYINGPINSLSSWKTNSNGTGTSPGSFLSGSNTFIIWNSLGGPISPTLTGTWNFGSSNALQIGNTTGSATLTIDNGAVLNLQNNSILRVGATTGTVGAKLYINTTGNLNITSGAFFPLRVYNNATLTIASSTFPPSNRVYLNNGTPGSYVEFAQTTGTTLIWRRTYRNLIISGGGIKQQNSTGTLRVTRELQMINGGLLMHSSTSSTLRLSGTISGIAPIMTSNSNLTIDGTGNFGTIYFANGNTAMSIRNLTINRNSLGQINLGTNLTVNGTTSFSKGVVNLNNNTLTFNGSVTLPTSTTNGYFIGSRNSSLVFSGAGAITNNLLMSTATLTTSSLYNLTINRTNRSITIGNPLYIWGELTAATGTINTNGNITIKADPLQKGRVAPIGTNADIIGNVTMEIIAPGGATGWNLLSCHGITSQSFTGWDDNIVITCPTCPDGSTAGGNPFTSVYSYCEPCATGSYSAFAHYVPLSSINNSLSPGTGYWTYVGTSTYTTNNINIDLTGTLVKKNFGSISLTTNTPNDYQEGWNLVGNPYPSPISFTNILSSMGSNSVNIDNVIYVWNPDLNGGAGDYGVYSPSGGSIPPVGSGGIDNNIPIGQGFYLHALNNVILLPSENWKTTLNNQNNLLKTISGATTQPVNSPNVYPPSLLILQMQGPNNYNVYTGIAIHPNATNTLDPQYDASQLGSDPPAPQLMSVSNNTAYKINTVPLINGSYTLDIKAITGLTGTYSIQAINKSNFSNGACISLYDKFTNINHDLSSGTYTFVLHDTTTVPRFILNITNNSISATTTIIQQPSCNSSNNGIATINIMSGSPPYTIALKDANGNTIITSTTSSNTYTFNNLYPGNYFCEVSSLSSCASTVYQINATPANTIFPVSQFVLSTNDTLPLNLSSPFIATNQSTNFTNIEWLLIGDGYTSTSNTFSYMPSVEGEYILQLTAYNSCNDTSIYQIPIVVVPGPDSPSSLSYSPDGSPVFTSKATSSQNTEPVVENTDPEIKVFYEVGGYYIYSSKKTTVNICITDVLGRIIHHEKNTTLHGKHRLNLPVEKTNQILILNIETNTKNITEKLIY